MSSSPTPTPVYENEAMFGTFQIACATVVFSLIFMSIIVLVILIKKYSTEYLIKKGNSLKKATEERRNPTVKPDIVSPFIDKSISEPMPFVNNYYRPTPTIESQTKSIDDGKRGRNFYDEIV
jgi:hypothetical protein